MMNDTSRQILSTNKSISNQIAKFCRFTSTFCKILSIKTLFKFPKSLNNGLNRSFLYEFSLLSRTFPDSPKIFSIKIPGFPEILEFLHHVLHSMSEEIPVAYIYEPKPAI